HDRVVRGVDTLLTESSRRFAQPFPRLAKIIGKMTGQSGFRCAPAIMRFSPRPIACSGNIRDRPLEYILPRGPRVWPRRNDRTSAGGPNGRITDSSPIEVDYKHR